MSESLEIISRCIQGTQSNVIQLDQGTYRKIGKEKANKQEHKRPSTKKLRILKLIIGQ